MANGSTRNLYLAATVACMTGALFGYSVGYIGGVLVLPSFLHHFHLDKLPPAELAAAQAGPVSAWLVGALFGVPLGMPICSRLGRKSCLTFSALLYVVGATLQLVDVNKSLALFNFGRLLNGLGVGAGTLVSPMYICEIAPLSERGMLLSGYQTAIQAAALAGFWAACAAHSNFSDSSSLQWKIPVAVQLLPGLLLLFGSLFVPEAPAFLADKGDLDAAVAALAWLRRLPRDDPSVKDEVEVLENIKAATATKEHSAGFLRQLRSRSLRKRLILGSGLMIAQNMVGLNALNYYAPVIFMSAGFTSVSTSLLLTGLFGLVKVLTAISFMFVFVKMRSNRFWLKFGSAVCGISIVILAFCVRDILAYDHIRDDRFDAQGVVSVLMVYVFAFAFGVSLGPISWNVCSEIFPSHLKAKCCAITTCVQWLFQIVIAGVTPHLLASLGWATYLVYAVFCAISFVWVTFFVPETKGVALGKDMDDLFELSLGSAVAEEHSITEVTSLLADGRCLARRDSVGLPI
ncbi:hypothetical protein LTR66_006029 [Elasticomyces elasticus]|nr:hypothetical protein LTR66_006029 [Elasticomyces elasticus]KAK5009463.1 hypothetical protein LTR28_000951 [Elasticomyces elasticus]